MTEFILVRHGESTGNASQYIQGQSDSDLTDNGRRQALALGKFLLDRNPKYDLILSSPQTRAAETAKILSSELSIPIEFDDVWKERNFGEIEGFTRDEIQQKKPSIDFFHPFNTPAPGAESLNDLYTRTHRGLNKLAKLPIGNYILISHGAFLNMLMYAITGISPITNSFRIRFIFENTGYSHLSYEQREQVWRIRYFNRTDHLIVNDNSRIKDENSNTF